MNRRALVLAFAAITLCFAPRLYRDSAPALAAGPLTTHAVAAPVHLAPIATTIPPAETVTTAPPADDAKPSAASASPSLFFGDSGPVALAEIPAGPFRDSLEALSHADRATSLHKLAALHIPRSQLDTLRATPFGGLLHICPSPDAASLPADTAPAPRTAVVAGASVPISNPPALNSKPGAGRVLYLDFNGSIVTGTAWNSYYGVARYDALPYDIDGNYATFNDEEQAIIREVWARVSEDYAPFDINVTTIDPGSSTSPFIGRVLITQAVDANRVFVPGGQNSGGIAYVGVFGDSDYAFHSPAWAIADNVGTDNAANIAEVVSHEFGHNLGLSHDGTATLTYYGGHGSGATSWGPIMGTAYGRNVGTFNPGDYYGANNPQDDLAIITARVPYRPDEVGDSIGSATVLGPQGSVTTGRIEQSTDVDVFRLTTASGAIAVQITTFSAASNTRGNNLDLAVELLNAVGNRVAYYNPTTSPDVSISTVAQPGTYYLRLVAVGVGNPASSNPTGYSSYGSIGTYSITNNTNPTPPPGVLQEPVGVAVALGATHTFTVVADSTVTAYQWLFNGTAITGATSSSLTLSSISFSKAGSYACVVFNGAASAITQPAQLAVYRNTPRLLTVNPGSNITFPTLTAGAFDDLSWSHDGQTIVRNADPRVLPTGAALRINGVAPSDAGVYTLAASFDDQPVAVGPVTLAVRPPVVLSTSETVTVDRGKVPAIGLVSSHENLTYSYSGLPPGVSFDSTTGLLNAVSASPGDYSLKVTGVDAFGNAGSATFLLVVQARTLPFTVSALLRAYPNSAPPLGAQNDSPLASYTYTGLPPGALQERSTGRITFSQTVRAGDYPVTVSVTDIYGNTASASFTLQVSALPVARTVPYVGVIDRHPVLNSSLGGRITLTPVISKGAPTGNYTGSLSLGTVNYALSGRISDGGPDSDLTLKLTATARGRSALSLAVTLPLDGSAPASGTLAAGATTVAFSAWPASYGKTKPATAFVGNHVFALLPPDEESAAEPAGIGFGSLSVNAVGKASWSATLADGTRATGSSALGFGGQVPVFVLLPAPGGSLHGSVALSAPTRAVDGELTWLRARASTKAYPTAVLYRDGFGPIALTALGGPLVVPPAGTRVLGLSAASPGVKLTFSSGGLTESHVAQLALPSLTVTTKNLVVRPTTAVANPAALALSLQPGKGTFGGSFLFKEPNPLKPGAYVLRKAVFAGVLLGNQGTGYFLFPGVKTSLAAPAPTLSGPVTLEPLPGVE